jgi:uncharacterized protein (DUF486 family)
MWTVLLLICSNAFMTVAWYGHLRFRGYPLWAVVLVSWLIALPEYAFQVPANRIGYGYFSATQLKIIQEAVSVGAFVVFGYVYLKEAPSWPTGIAFLLVLGRSSCRPRTGRRQRCMTWSRRPGMPKSRQDRSWRR